MATPDRCSWHRPLNLPTKIAQTDWERRHATGQKQWRCSICERWFWTVERGRKPDGLEQRWQSEAEAESVVHGSAPDEP